MPGPLSKLNKYMKNKSLVELVSVLTPLTLDIEKSSARRRFLRHISGFNEDYASEAQEIHIEFGEKNPDGSLKVMGNIVQFTKENRKKADDKFNTLNALDIPIDWSGEEKDKEVIIGILNGLIEELKKPNEFTDNSYAHLESIQDIIAELSK